MKQVPGETTKQPTFEEAMARLERVVRQLESGELSLDESLKLFQEGMALARQCSGLLDEAEGRIEELLEGAGGRPALRPMDLGGEGA